MEKKERERELKRLIEHRAFVREVARRVLGRDPAVDDVVQETYTTAWKADRSTVRNLRGWLGRIARNLALQELRARKRRMRREQAAARAEKTPSVSGIIANEEVRRRLVQRVMELEEPLREVLRLRFEGGLSYPEIGKALSLTADGARSRVRDALRRLQATDILGDRPSRRLSWLWPFLWPWRRSHDRPERKRRRRLAMAAALLATTATLWLFVAGREDTAVRTADRSASTNTGTGVEGASDPVARTGPDDDPNRVPGPDSTLVGRVVAGGRPVPGARVVALRAYDRLEASDAKRTPPLDSTLSDGEGRFSLRVTRRTRLTLEADHEDYAPNRVLVVIPPEGDPEGTTIYLHPALPVAVVAHGAPDKLLSGVHVRVTLGNGVMAPTIQKAITNARGLAYFRLRDPDQHSVLRIEGRGPNGEFNRFTPIKDESVRGEHIVHPIHLFGEYAIEGVVRTVAGQPVAGATVRIVVRKHPLNLYWNESVTDDKGRFVARHLPPQPIDRIEVTPPKDARLARVTVVPEVAVFGSKPRPTRLDVTLPAARRVRGVVLRGASRETVHDAQVLLYQRRGDTLHLLQRARTDAEGGFEFKGLGAGEYAWESYAGSWARLANRRDRPETPITVDFTIHKEDPPLQLLRLGPTGSVLVRMPPVPWTTLPGRSHEDQILVPVTVVSQHIRIETLADANGIARFDHVPVSAKVHVHAPNGSIGPRNVLHEQRTVVELPPPPGLETVTVRVLDAEGKPAPHAAVGLFPENTTPITVRTVASRRRPPRGIVHTDRSGVALLRPNGDSVRALSAGWLLVAKTPSSRLTRVRGRTWPPGDRGTITVRLAPGLTITGTVEGRGGQPISIIRLRQVPGAPPVIRVTGWTWGEDTFVVRGLEPGVHKILATTAFANSPWADVEAGAKDVVLRIRSRRRKPIAGRVVTQGGEPVEGAILRAVGENGIAIVSVAPSLRNGSVSVQVTEGAYQVQIIPGESQVVFPPTEPIELPAGSVGIEFQVDAQPGVSGVVVDGMGRAIPTARVTARSRKTASLRPMSKRVTEYGVFTFPGLSKDYDELVVVAPHYVPKVVPVEKRRTGVRVPLRLSTPIRGVVRRETGAPATGVELRLVPLDAAARASVKLLQTPAGSWAFSKVSRRRTVAPAADGSFVFAGFGAGTYAIVCATAPPGFTIRPHRVRTGDREIALVLEPSRRIAGRVVGAASGARVRVRVLVDGIVCAEAAVSNGRFELPNLPGAGVQCELLVNGKVVDETHAGPETEQVSLNAR